MTACTERHPAAPDDGLAGEGQKGMPGQHGMTACTERHPAAPDDGLAGEGQKGMPGQHRMTARAEPRHRRSGAGPDWRDRALSVLLGAAVVVLLGLAAGGLSGVRLVLLKSGSMTPSLRTGDLVVSRSTPPARIGPGDIVTFQHPALRTAVTHRVVSARTAGGWVEVTTKGDANQVAEDWRVPVTGRVGRVLGRVPGAGVVVRAVSPRSAAATLVGAGGGYLGLLLLRRIWRGPARPRSETGDCSAGSGAASLPLTRSRWSPGPKPLSGTAWRVANRNTIRPGAGGEL